MKSTAPAVHAAIEFTLRQDRGRLLAALVAVLGDFELAEECLQDATEKALSNWVVQGVPGSRRGWLLQVARRRALDRLRRGQNFARKAAQIAVLEQAQDVDPTTKPDIPDERLRLIFTCCHPALEEKTRIALTLRTLGGLTTEEVARAFLDTKSAMAQRLARARAKITGAQIPFAIPEGDELAPRLGSVLKVIYLIYNEGYRASEGTHQVRLDLCTEALFLARLLVKLAPNEPEVLGLLALILFSLSRRPARLSAQGDYVPLDQQDRGLWDKELILEAENHLSDAMLLNRRGPFQIQAAISAVHCAADQANATDWPQIAALYFGLYAIEPTPVVQLNHIIALSRVTGPKSGLEKMANLKQAHPDITLYQPYHAALADLLVRAERWKEAQSAFAEAIDISNVQSERRYLQKMQKLSAKYQDGKKRPRRARP